MGSSPTCGTKLMIIKEEHEGWTDFIHKEMYIQLEVVYKGQLYCPPYYNFMCWLIDNRPTLSPKSIYMYGGFIDQIQMHCHANGKQIILLR